MGHPYISAGTSHGIRMNDLPAGGLVMAVHWIGHHVHLISATHITMYGVKGKVILVQAVEALRVVRGWGSHIFWHSAHRWRQGCQPYAPASFYPQDGSWYSFLLEDESTPGP
jgi:hypothetical protein